jgi:hypothetical protein
MAKNGYDQTYEDDRKENEETRALIKKAVMAPINAVKPKETKADTGETTNPMGDKYKKGGKVKKMADGGETGGLEEAIRLERMGVTPRMLREQTASNELQDLLPSGKKIGAALRSKLDPEAVAEMAMPQMAIARKIADAAKNAKMPKSYADASGMKKGGKVKSASSRADGCAIRGKTRA